MQLRKRRNGRPCGFIAQKRSGSSANRCIPVVPCHQKMDAHAIIRHPCTTENAMQKIENERTLTFFVHKRANKHQIKAVAKKLFDIQIEKVNTLITPKGEKKAFI